MQENGVSIFFNNMPSWFGNVFAVSIFIIIFSLIFLLFIGANIKIGKFELQIGRRRKNNSQNYLLFEKLELLNKKIFEIEEKTTKKQQMTQAETKLRIILDGLNSGFLEYVNSLEDSLNYQKINYFSLFLEYFEKRQKEEIRNMLNDNLQFFSVETSEKDFNDFKGEKVEEFIIIGSKIFERYYSNDMNIRNLFRNDNDFIADLKKIIDSLINECREIQISNQEKIKSLMNEKEIIYKKFE
jgi:hypothetical protein